MGVTETRAKEIRLVDNHKEKPAYIEWCVRSHALRVDLTVQKVLVTGAGGFLGQALCVVFLLQGGAFELPTRPCRPRRFGSSCRNDGHGLD